MTYYVEVVWNREFDFVRYGDGHVKKAQAVAACREAENSGDGARVKKARVVNDRTSKVVFAYGQYVKQSQPENADD